MTKQTRWGRLAQAAQPVERLDDWCIAPKEDTGVLGFKRAKAAIGGVG